MRSPDPAPTPAHPAAATPPPVPAPGGDPLISAEEAERLRSRWTAIKGAFPDDPERSVAQASELLDEFTRLLTGRLAVSLGDDKHSTEDLRIALQRYRTFFERLLSA
jgi:hypothetical protein